MAGNIIQNSKDLRLALIAIANSVIVEVTNEIMKMLQNRIIEDVYEYDPMPRRWYYNKTGRPTYEFLRAFQWHDIKSTLTEITKELYYNWPSMNYDPKTYLHGSKTFGDLRHKLADILNVNGLDSFYNFTARERRPYWDNFIDQLFSGGEGGEINSFFEKALRKYGGIY
jgi:hypothetical protein